MDAEAGAPFGQTRGFLFSDLRGYTDYVERYGDDAAARLLERYRVLVRGVVARNAGAEVRTEGDSFYVLFPSASSAVVAALDIVASAASESADHPDAPIRVGVGVHAGETSDLPEGPVGSAVNLAARICAQAKAGEVLVSDTVRGLTRTRQVATFTSIGAKRLKGIAEPVVLYRAVPPGSAATAAGPVVTSRLGRPTTSRGALVGIGAIALLLLALGGFALLNGLGGASTTASPGSSITGAATTATPEATRTGTDASPAGSADPTAVPVTGTRIIYSRQSQFEGAPCDEMPRDAKLYVLDPDSDEVAPYRLTVRSNLIELSPSWSEDGSTIAFIGSIARGPGGLNTIEPSRENLTTVVAPRALPGVDPFLGNRLVVSTDDEAVLHLSADAIWRSPLQGGPSEGILFAFPPEEPPEGPPTESYHDMALMPDGRLLVLVGPFEQGPFYLDAVTLDGRDRERLDFDLSTFEGPRSLAVNGDRLAMVAGRNGDEVLLLGPLDGDEQDLVEVAVDLSGMRHINFSPDGTKLVVQAEAAVGSQIYVVDADTGESRQLTDDPAAQACRPVWRDAPPDMAQPLPPPEPGATRSFELGLLESGEYLNDIVIPPVALTFPEGWIARRSYIDGWSVYHPDTAGEVDSARLQVAAAGACLDEEHPETVVIGDTPAELIAFVQGREDLESSNAGAINLGGFTGLSIEVTGKVGEGCGDPEFPYWALFQSGEDFFSLGPDEHLRLISLDVRGTPVSFLVFSDQEGADAYFAEHAGPLLQTVAFPTE